MATPNALFSTFSFIGFLFCAIPLYWHLEAWNVGTSLYMVWAGLGCLNAFINSVVWNHSVANVAPVWCDISTRFIVGAAVGIPAALLVISRRLYKIATRTATFVTTAEKRRDICIDLAIGLGIPILQMVLEIIVEGHRFDIFEDVGCYPNFYNVPLAFPLVYIWPLVINIVTAVYSCLNIRLFWKSSQQLKDMLGSNTIPHQNRYIRLIALCSTQIFCTLPMTIFPIYFNARVAPMFPWISWDDTHFNYSFVDQIPSVVWRASAATETALELYRWFLVLSAFLYFAFFGFAEEARKNYRLAYSFASTRLRLPEFVSSRACSSSPSSTTSSFGPGLKKGMATLFSFKDGFSVLASRNQHDTMTEHRDSSSVFDNRLTSDTSIFEGIDNYPKAIGFLPDEHDRFASAPQNIVVTMPVIPRVPIPPPPVANVAGRPIHPGGLDSPLPHRPTSYYPDIPEDV